MATYQAITSSQIDAESYLDSVLAGQWTNNLTAVIENDASAPNIVNLTEESMSAIGDGQTLRMFQALTGNHTIYAAPAYEIVDRSEWVVPRSGTYTLKFDLRDTHLTSGGGSNQGNVRARFYKNSVPAYSGDVATGAVHSEGDGSWSTKTESGIALNAGDVVMMYVHSNTGPRVSIRNIIWSAGSKLFGG